MRQLQARVVHPQLTPEQQIQIEAARAPALLLRSVAAELLFQPLEGIQQFQGGGIAARDVGGGADFAGGAAQGLVRS